MLIYYDFFLNKNNSGTCSDKTSMPGKWHCVTALI